MRSREGATHDTIVFDLDGTISDPLEGISRSINYALDCAGYPRHTATDLARFIGPPLDESFAVIVGSTDAPLIAGLVAKYRERYGDVGYAENVLYPGVADELARLAAVGFRIGLCTSKRVDFAEQILQMFGLRDRFEFVDGGDVGVAKWQQIEELGRRGIVTHASVMVGDRAVDLIAAHRNGLAGAGVLWGYGSKEELETEPSAYLFATPGDISAQLIRS